MQPLSAEELTETAVKAWKRCFLIELQMSQPLFILSPFCSRDCLTKKYTFYCYFVTIEQSTGHVQKILCLECMVYYKTVL